jgi:tRNA pseudouridine55 synthase
MQPFNGLLLIDKPAGISSFGVVGRVRWALSQVAGKKVKVGHTGTLDPFATGLMIIVVGDYCKRASEFSKLDKSYEALVRLGETSTTGDPEGEITPHDGPRPSREQVEQAMAKFRGEITQTPPAYSAIKINGQRAYKLARAGQAVEMPSRTVTVSKLETLAYGYPELRIVCDVSSGTYIRTLAEDIGAALGTGAYTAELRRTRVGQWHIANAVTLESDDFASALMTLPG